MIAALRRAAAYTGRLIEAAVNARTLARTVRILSRQLDNAHLLAASEEARADRAEAALATARANITELARLHREAVALCCAARERVAELEAQQRDWAELSGELAADPQADALPDLTDAGEAPTSVVDHAREAAYQCDRANALAATLHATEAVVLDLRGRIQSLEREAKEARAQLAQTERAAGAHLATIERLQEQIASRPALVCRSCGGPCEESRRDSPVLSRTCYRCAPAEQIQGVAAAHQACEDFARELAADDPPPRIAPREVRYAAVMKVSAEIDAAADDPPPTRPSSATRTT